MSAIPVTGTPPPATCADASVAAGEALAGTSTQATDWLVVERRGTWGRDAVADADSPGASATRSSSFSSSVLLIRRPTSRARDGRLPRDE